MIIKNALVFGKDNKFNLEDIHIKGEFLADSFSDKDIIDATGLYAIPGLTDIHFHGCLDNDFCDGTYEAINKIAKYQSENGVTTICPATMTLAEDELTRIVKAAASYDNKEGAILCGINMEGPYMSLEKKGAQNPKYIKEPNLKLYKNLQEESGGLIKLVAIAPEESGAMEFIKELKDQVRVSIAHTTANYNVTVKAFESGARQVTHLYNAMPPFNHRDPGVIGAAFDNENVYVELITDGLHIHPSVVRATLKMFGDDRVIIISDCMRATGMPDGMYSLGGQPVKKTGNKASLVDGTIAGSVTNLMDCVRIAVKDMGIPLESAIKCAAVNSAKSIGIFDYYGSIEAGKVANLVLLDKDLNIVRVILRGKEIILR